jgi:multidrug efflux pump subunit AcrA (membrane-fusion protein)
MSDKENETETVEPEVETTEETEQEPSLDDLRTELENTQKALKKANKEAADRRKKLEKLEAAEEERKKAEMSELEKLQAERDEAVKAAEAATKAANARLLKATIIAKAVELNFTDPNDAYALLDKSELTLADDGSVEGLDEELTRLAEAKPYMLKGDRRDPSLRPTHPVGGRPGETDTQRRERLGI